MTCAVTWDERGTNVILVYEPEGAAAERHDLSGLTFREIRALTDAVGEAGGERDFDAIENSLRDQEPVALAAALWVMRRRTDSALEWAAFDVPRLRQTLRVRMTTAEIGEYMSLADRRGISDDQRTELQVRLWARAEDQAAVDKLFKGQGPKGARSRA